MVVLAQDVASLRKKTGAGMMDCKKALVEAGGDFEKAIDFLRKKGQKIFVARATCNACEGAVFSCVNGDQNAAFVLTLNSETDFVARNEKFLELGHSILQVVVHHQPTCLEQLKALPFDGTTVQEALINFMGTVGEKITLSAYEMLKGDMVVSYIHTGNTLAVLVAFQGGKGDSVMEVGKDVAMQIAAMNPLAISREQVNASVIERELAIIKDQVAMEGHTGDKAERIIQGKLNKFLQENTLLEQQFVKDNKLTVAQYLKSVNPSLTVTAFKRVSVNM